MAELDLIAPSLDVVLNLDEVDESISVSQLNKLAKTLLENNMPILWIKGEISGIRKYSHVYFDLKDEGAKISCVIFAGIVKLIDFPLDNGTQIEVRGKVTIYPQNGSYQINVERVRRVGLGALWEAYNRLLNKLKAEGLFDTVHKKSLPVFPRTIGVVTSKDGSVIRDVVTTLKRRMPNIPIIIYHSAVQGTDASLQLSKAIRLANERKEVDVLIVCRGGGSMEDLWCFNEEVVVREVFNSNIPVISAVGHETDTTLIDFVSDLRAPTPTAAAELVAISRNEWLSRINQLHDKLSNGFNYILDDKRQELSSYITQLKYLNPVNQIKQKLGMVSNFNMRLQLGIKQLISSRRQRLDYLRAKFDTRHLNLSSYQIQLLHLHDRLNKATKQVLINKSAQLTTVERDLELLNPHNILSRGYAIVKNKRGNVVQSSNDVVHNERIELVLRNDSLSAIVDKKYNANQEELI